jgi:hypothetical protein
MHANRLLGTDANAQPAPITFEIINVRLFFFQHYRLVATRITGRYTNAASIAIFSVNAGDHFPGEIQIIPDAD